MGTQTFPCAAFADGAVQVEMDVNDATWRPSRVRCLNTSNRTAVAEIYRAGSLVFTETAPANQTTTWNISGVQLGWDSVNGGVLLGDYTVSVRWPAN